ncbi:MAG: GatB/YqeY domain-containing protein [Bacteroidales bacterium]|jgi:hypothetical protein
MSLVDKINADIKTAMLAKEAQRLEALRAIKAELLLANTSGQAVTEDTEIKILQKLIKQRKEAAEIFAANKREDLAAHDLFQAEVTQEYLPKQMSEDELIALLKNIITQTGAAGIKDMGKVMGMASKQLAGKADNKVVSEIVKKLLGA